MTFCGNDIQRGNSLDKLRHPSSDAYSAEQVLLNKQQILGGRAYPDCYLKQKHWTANMYAAEELWSLCWTYVLVVAYITKTAYKVLNAESYAKLKEDINYNRIQRTRREWGWGQNILPCHPLVQSTFADSEQSSSS